jgi:hypothetical protein
LPGVYQTAVNIHNPNPQGARLRKKLAVRSGQISPFVDSQLKPDEAASVDCSQVQNFGIPFIHGFEGFLVIESTLSLDVVAVYTAGAKGARSRASTSSTSQNAGSGDGPSYRALVGRARCVARLRSTRLDNSKRSAGLCTTSALVETKAAGGTPTAAYLS